MKNNGFHELFMDQLEDMLGSEKQILKALPKMIKAANLPELKEALSSHLEETEQQVERLEQIFSILGVPSKEKKCKAMEGILHEGDEMLGKGHKSPILDAAIIAAGQKVEHYEIATYGTLRSFAKHLNLDDEILDLLQDNLNEEGAADKKLTKLAEGTFFSAGINQEAAEKRTTK